MLNVNLRLQLLAFGAVAAAVWLAWQLAQGSYVVPVLVATAALGGIVVRVMRTGLTAVLLGAVLFGYMVGNRGFAQLMPVPGMPLLPAEIVLLTAGGWLVLECAYSRRLPFHRDGLNWAVLAWLVVGTARIAFDVRVFGLMAVRDYAMIYYALFFFLAQELSADPRARRFLLICVTAACLLQPVAAVASDSFPEFFLSKLVINGAPLIYFKGDLALTFMGLSALFLAAIASPSQRRWLWPLATVGLLYVLGGDNRASMLGAFAALAWLSLSHLRRFVFAQALVLTLALAVIAALAHLADHEWSERKLAGTVERLQSLGDFLGAGTYASEESAIKGDNNRFRSVWWRAVANETLAQSPVFGLGFGYDLARGFLQSYNPDMADDFSARSPHSIVVSVFGRLGIVGLLVFSVFVAVLAMRTRRAMRDPGAGDTPALGLWAAVWVILVSACFGVVLEGPMGAVLFWTLLGLANTAETPAEPVDTPPALPSEAPSA